MIFTFLLNSIAFIINAVVAFLVAHLPPVSSVSGLADSFVHMSYYISAVNFWFPMDVVVAWFVGVILLFEKGWTIYQGLRWGYQKIPGVN